MFLLPKTRWWILSNQAFKTKRPKWVKNIHVFKCKTNRLAGFAIYFSKLNISRPLKNVSRLAGFKLQGNSAGQAQSLDKKGHFSKVSWH